MDSGFLSIQDRARLVATPMGRIHADLGGMVVVEIPIGIATHYSELFKIAFTVGFHHDGPIMDVIIHTVPLKIIKIIFAILVTGAWPKHFFDDREHDTEERPAKYSSLAIRDLIVDLAAGAFDLEIKTRLMDGLLSEKLKEIMASDLEMKLGFTMKESMCIWDNHTLPRTQSIIVNWAVREYLIWIPYYKFHESSGGIGTVTFSLFVLYATNEKFRKELEYVAEGVKASGKVWKDGRTTIRDLLTGRYFVIPKYFRPK